MNRVFKIVGSCPSNPHSYKKKRIYTSLEDFNFYCINGQREPTLPRYKKIYELVKCYEKLNNKRIEIDIQNSKNGYVARL